jgi:hypothetical protein
MSHVHTIGNMIFKYIQDGLERGLTHKDYATSAAIQKHLSADTAELSHTDYVFHVEVLMQYLLQLKADVLCYNSVTDPWKVWTPQENNAILHDMMMVDTFVTMCIEAIKCMRTYMF